MKRPLDPAPRFGSILDGETPPLREAVRRMGWQTVVCEVTFPVAQVVKHDPLTAKAARMLDVSPEMVGRATKIQATSPKIASEVLKGNLTLDQAEQRLNVDDDEPLDVAETICITVRKLQAQGATDQEIAAALDRSGPTSRRQWRPNREHRP